MKSRAILLASALFVSAALGDMRSTVDEWIDRFTPEGDPKIELPSYANDLDRARAEVTAGKYRAAISTLYKIETQLPDLASDPETRHFKALALAGLGETDDALRLLSTELKLDVAQLLAGQILLDAERPIEALAAADKVIERSADSIPAHLLKGQSLEALGQFKEAIDTYNWFLDGQESYLKKWQTDPNQFENPDDITAIATAINRWATLTQSFKSLPELNDTILNMFIRTFDVVDRQHIPSRLAAAEFAMARGDGKNALKYLGPAAQRAARDPRVLRLLIQVAFASSNDNAARQAIALFRDADPNSFDAQFWDAVMLARAQQWVRASDRSVAVQKSFPNRLEAIGLAAALEYIRGNENSLEPLLAHADQIIPGRSDAWLLAGSILSNASQEDAAERLLKEVLKRTPWENTARHELGHIYINAGREADAQVVLDEAFQSDPYNIKTVNFLRLLVEIEKYQKVQTEHFIIYVDPEADPIAAEQVGNYMESVYADVTKVFQYEPKMKIIVQIYPSDDEFSVRMDGMPGVLNFGVSFGRSMAMVAPRRGTQQGNFNWARVMRHEFVHTVNLLQTNHRTPRWLTEGLAVWQEGVPFRYKEVPEELYKRTMADQLYTIRGLPLAFIGAHGPADKDQDYTQGSYLARYIDATFGKDAIVKLLNAYSTSKNDDDAFRAATGKSLMEVETGWHEWMKVQLKSWGYDKESKEKVAALMKEGEQALKAEKYVEAEKSFADAYALQPYNITVNQRLALIYLQKDTANPAKSVAHLKYLHILELQNNKFAKQVARMYVKIDDLPNALKWAKEATYVDMYDASSHELIADIATKMNNPELAARAMNTVEQIKQWEIQRAKPATQRAN